VERSIKNACHQHCGKERPLVLLLLLLLLLFIVFMQGIYNYMPETNHVSIAHSAEAIL
jgi:hypothetical protein